jgi:hypothetical protein
LRYRARQPADEAELSYMNDLTNGTHFRNGWWGPVEPHTRFGRPAARTQPCPSMPLASAGLAVKRSGRGGEVVMRSRLLSQQQYDCPSDPTHACPPRTTRFIASSILASRDGGPYAQQCREHWRRGARFIASSCSPPVHPRALAHTARRNEVRYAATRRHLENRSRGLALFSFSGRAIWNSRIRPGAR